MRVLIRVLLMAVLVSSVVPAVGEVNTSSHVRRLVSLWFSAYDVMANTSRDGGLFVEVLEGATTVSTSAAPSTSYRATAYHSVCDWNANVCTSQFFNWQTISLTGLTMDPAANSATVDACLLPSNGGNCVDFDLVFSRPETLSSGFLCYPTVVCGVNAWWEPDGSAAHAGLNTQLGIIRTGYTVSGTFAGAPYVAPVNGLEDVQGWYQLLANEQVNLP